MFYSVAINKGSETKEKNFLENISRAMERKCTWFFFYCPNAILFHNNRMINRKYYFYHIFSIH